MKTIGRLGNGVYLIILTLMTVALSWVFGLNNYQIAAVGIFAFKTFSTLFFWRFRLSFALISVFVLLFLGLLDVPHLIEFASFDVILFLIGMMIVVGFLEENNFFEYLIDKILSLFSDRPERVIMVLFLSSAVFAALVDEVTSILFMTATILHLTISYNVNPVPFIMMSIFATNIGSSATVVGNPVGVMIALKGDLSFSDFLRWATPISVVALILTLFICTRLFSKEIKELSDNLRKSKLADEEKRSYPKKKIQLCWAIFILTISSLIGHHLIEEMMHLEKNTLLIGVALLFGGISLFIEREQAHEIVEKRVDWWTLTFFALLFASVGTLKYVGVTKLLANGVFQIAQGSDTLMFIIFTWVVGFMSAFMDNVLAVATFTPVVQDLAELGVYNFPLWWGMLFAGTFFGNLTVIGSTANIVAVGMLERRHNIHIKFTDWIKYGALVAFPTLIVATVMLLLQMPLMPH